MASIAMLVRIDDDMWRGVLERVRDSVRSLRPVGPYETDACRALLCQIDDRLREHVDFDRWADDGGAAAP